MPDQKQIVTREEYNNTTALNFSGSKFLLQSPAHYRAYLAADREETKPLRMGTLTHALVLEPDTVAARFAVSVECDRRTKIGKEAFEAFLAANIGKTTVSPDEMEVCTRVADSMLALQKTIGVKFVATELMLLVDYNGVPLKSAIDAVGDDGFIYDLKTTADDASPKGFLSSIRAFRYNLQAYMYRLVYELYTGQRLNGVRFIVTEKVEPYCSAVYEIGPELMSYAVSYFEKVVDLYKTSTLHDEWPGYPTTPQVVDLNAKASTATPINFA
jgi:exodeoxyribonuclease VIII